MTDVFPVPKMPRILAVNRASGIVDCLYQQLLPWLRNALQRFCAALPEDLAEPFFAALHFRELNRRNLLTATRPLRNVENLDSSRQILPVRPKPISADFAGCREGQPVHPINRLGSAEERVTIVAGTS
jgi:hypothetical protein